MIRRTTEAFLKEGIYYHLDWSRLLHISSIVFTDSKNFQSTKQKRRWFRPASYYQHIPQRAFAPVDHATPRRLQWAKKHFAIQK